MFSITSIKACLRQQAGRAQRATFFRSVQTQVAPSAIERKHRKEREEGDISSVFSSLSGEKERTLPPRFAELKRSIIGDEANQQRLVASWGRLTQHLAKVAHEIESGQQDCIPETTYDEFINHRTPGLEQRIKTCGSVIIRDVVDEQTALNWLADLKSYIDLNPSVKGFPEKDKQVFELYWSRSQLSARSHPRAMAVQRALLGLFSHTPTDLVSLHIPITYADRLRIRHPGDAQFALGPHADGGSVERWEDETYRRVYHSVLEGRWEEFDSWTIGERAQARQSMYDGPGSCGVFRAFQGWTSMSNTGPNEGTLQVYPLIKELSAYTMLRPLFRQQPRTDLDRDGYLAPANWELDLETSRFPGSPLARCQEYNDTTHPHLELDRTMIAIPRVKPGDQAWWHGGEFNKSICQGTPELMTDKDVIHAVEKVHNGKGPSAVMYIPAVPLTLQNAAYVNDQKQTFLKGKPGPDFPGGAGESDFEGRGQVEDIESLEGRRAMGLEPFDVSGSLASGEREVRKQANTIIGS
ncbi:hypothetical protein L202_05400 [Cryptococcus amylolentus CBS 6039]|uniref:DUF1479-domain-containing protein n=1 Tax=Cryptococcus amylolentus CBS 6039 TaxID=1295533 RepID=A0A1E3HKD0_9TREE|nr:hypothetical protein L202_05400 [Cryptococcus amylolentus CBS 6039]ODN76798.1 hypothetical protein L202_05400 [Cryptococcus amylolentus CBS 6039]